MAHHRIVRAYRSQLEHVPAKQPCHCRHKWIHHTNRDKRKRENGARDIRARRKQRALLAPYRRQLISHTR
jgi:hypothetical protein